MKPDELSREQKRSDEMIPAEREARGGPWVCLYYREPMAAIEFLEKAFGFKRARVAPLPNGHIIYSELSYDFGDGPWSRGAIGVEQAIEDAGRYGELSSPSQWGPRRTIAIPIIVVKDEAALQAVFDRAVAAGAEVVTSPHPNDYSGDEYWGNIVFNNSEFIVRDPEGHMWSFATKWGRDMTWEFPGEE